MRTAAALLTLLIPAVPLCAQDGGAGAAGAAKDGRALLEKAEALIHHPVEGVQSFKADAVTADGDVVVRLTLVAKHGKARREDLKTKIVKKRGPPARVKDQAELAAGGYGFILFGDSRISMPGRDKTVTVESGKNPVVVVPGRGRSGPIRYHVDGSTGCVFAVQLGDSERMPHRNAMLWRRHGDRFVLAAREFEFGMEKRRVGEVIAYEYFSCGDVEIPWRVAHFEGKTLRKEVFLKNVYINGERYKTPREARSEDKEKGPPEVPWPWGQRQKRYFSVGAAMLPTSVNIVTSNIRIHAATRGSIPRSLRDLKDMEPEDLLDPWGRPWIYRRRGKDRFTLGTFGADGKKGGAGDDEDYFVDG